jgi:hypothetical protein
LLKISSWDPCSSPCLVNSVCSTLFAEGIFPSLYVEGCERGEGGRLQTELFQI